MKALNVGLASIISLSRLSTAITGLVATILICDGKPAFALGLTGLTDSNTLVFFDSATPGTTTSTAVSGVDGSLIGIDYRPANGLLYGLTTSNSIYTINPATGAATLVSTLSVPFTSGGQSGVDFNPVPDRLRVVGSNDQNFRINVDTGATIVDGTLNPGDPSITASAYTNSDNNPATGTTLYGINSILDILVIQNPPNNGTLVTVGSLGIDFNTVGGFDIATSNDGVNTAFAASNSTLYSINLSTGAATSLGAIDGSPTLVGLSADLPTAVPFEFSPLPGIALGVPLFLGLRMLKKRKALKVK